MERVTLEAKRREGLGSGQVRKLRQRGLVPGIVYGRGVDPTPVAVDARALRGVLRTHAGMNVLIDLAIGDGTAAGRTVMVKDVQRDIFRKDTILHVDFHTIDLTEKVEAHVPLVLKGTPRGVADEGGILEVQLREVLVECLPTQIPEHIEVDVTALGVGDSLHVRDIALPAGVTMISEPEQAVVTVVAPKGEEVAAPAAAPEMAAPAEGEAAAAAPSAGAAGKPAAAPAKPEEKDRGKGKE
ncbi:MAG TPA: 50S ribosomal protein L25 [bacterium]|nr:50S ribosomal protein L25 [bacterium]